MFLYKSHRTLSISCYIVHGLGEVSVIFNVTSLCTRPHRGARWYSISCCFVPSLRRSRLYPALRGLNNSSYRIISYPASLRTRLSKIDSYIHKYNARSIIINIKVRLITNYISRLYDAIQKHFKLKGRCHWGQMNKNVTIFVMRGLE